jgi:hypothetical protein
MPGLSREYVARSVPVVAANAFGSSPADDGNGSSRR